MLCAGTCTCCILLTTCSTPSQRQPQSWCLRHTPPCTRGHVAEVMQGLPQAHVRLQHRVGVFSGLSQPPPAPQVQCLGVTAGAGGPPPVTPGLWGNLPGPAHVPEQCTKLSQRSPQAHVRLGDQFTASADAVQRPWGVLPWWGAVPRVGLVRMGSFQGPPGWALPPTVSPYQNVRPRTQAHMRLEVA